MQTERGSRSDGRDLHVQIELGRYFGQRLQTVAFWKELDLLFLKSQRLSKSVEKWPSYGVKRFKMELKSVFRLKCPLESRWIEGSGGVGIGVLRGTPMGFLVLYKVLLSCVGSSFLSCLISQMGSRIIPEMSQVFVSFCLKCDQDNP